MNKIKTIKDRAPLVKKLTKAIDSRSELVSIYNYSLFIFGSGYNTAKYFKKVYQTKLDLSLINVRFNGETNTVVPGFVWEQCSTEFFTKYLKNPAALEKIEKDFYHNFPLINNLYNKYSYRYIKAEKEKNLLPLIGKSFDLFWQTNAYSHFSIYLDLDLCLKIVKGVYPKTSREEIEAIWTKATNMVAESFDKEQKRDILNYLIINGCDDKLYEHCQYFYADYKNVFSLNEVKIEIHKSYGHFLNNKKLVVQEIKKMDQALIKKRAEFTSWRHHLPPRQQKIVDFIQVVMRVRDERKNHFAKGITVAWRIAEKLFKEAKVNRQLIENVLPFTELMKGSKYIKKIKKELQRREKGYVVYVPYDGKIEVSYNNLESEHNLLNESLRKGNNNKTNEIIGQIGHRGLARGRVRIIKSAENFNSFKRGEILVSGMTRPEYVPLMHKAKAIITDEGGITCHAAIVSRELNKPCIIGTRFATQILKDGDLVVVDAEKGIVKIIKKSFI